MSAEVYRIDWRFFGDDGEDIKPPEGYTKDCVLAAAFGPDEVHRQTTSRLAVCFVWRLKSTAQSRNKMVSDMLGENEDG